MEGIELLGRSVRGDIERSCCNIESLGCIHETEKGYKIDLNTKAKRIKRLIERTDEDYKLKC